MQQGSTMHTAKELLVNSNNDRDCEHGCLQEGKPFNFSFQGFN
jgi:hypothetical protein